MNFNLTPVVKNLLILNLAIFLIGMLGFDLVYLGGLRYIFSDDFRPFQFASHMFIHSGFGHIFSNMFALFMFGPMLENVWGSKRFLTFYLVCGIGASVIYSGVHFYEIYPIQLAVEQYIIDPNPRMFVNFLNEYALGSSSANYDFLTAFKENPENEHYIRESVSYAQSIFKRRADVPMVGASGAVFGILMAFGMLFPNTELYLFLIPFPVKAKYFVMFYGLYELVTGLHNNPGDNVAHFAHIGGMIFAFILIKMWQKDRNHYY
jgi:membrane associated rhomboid family serine protease